MGEAIMIERTKLVPAKHLGWFISPSKFNTWNLYFEIIKKNNGRRKDNAYKLYKAIIRKKIFLNNEKFDWKIINANSFDCLKDAKNFILNEYKKNREIQ